MALIHIIYHSERGHTERLADAISQGVNMVGGCSSRMITVEQAAKEHVKQCEGLILGCPTHMGNVSAPMKKFIDDVISPVWMDGGIPIRSAQRLAAAARFMAIKSSRFWRC